MSFFRDEQIARNVDRLGIEWNRFGFDRFGASRDVLIRQYSPVAQLYRRYLKVTCFGTENVPATGRGLIVGNHSGGIGVDAAMTVTSLLLNDAAPRLAQGMADYFFARWPFIGTVTTRIGALTGLPANAELLMKDERLVLVFPEGAQGAAKLYKNRYQLLRFGTGFMRLALKMKVPVVPFAFVGGEETFPILFKLDRIAHAIGAPVLPIAPQIVMFPLPVSCQVYYGVPMEFDGDGSETDDIIQDYVGQVRDEVARLIERGLAARPSAFTMQPVLGPQ